MVGGHPTRFSSLAYASLLYPQAGLAAYFAGTGTDEANGIALAVVYPLFTIGGPTITPHIVGDTTSSSLPSASSTPPLTRGADGGQSDGFVTQLSSAGVFSTSPGPAFIGGNGVDRANAIAVTARTFFSHSCGGGFSIQCTTVAEYIVGDESSSDFLNGQLATKLGTSADESLTNQQAFVLKRAAISSNAPSLVWVAHMGGSSTDSGRAVTVDGSARTYVAGQAAFQFPTTSGAFQPNYGGANDGFVARIDLQPPALFQGPAEGSIVKSGDVTFNWNATDSPTFYCSNVTAGVLNNVSRIGCDPPKSYTGLADGPQTFGVSTIDAGGTQSDQVTRSFIVDTQPPEGFDLIAPDDNATVQTTKPTFSWHAAVDAATQVSYQVLVDGQSVASAGSDACDASGTCSVGAAQSVITGSHKWKVRATDQADHSTDSAERTIVVQDPPVAKFTIAPNPSLAGRSVAFDATGSNDATHTITHYEWDLDGDGSFESDAGPVPTISKAYAKPATVKISLRVTDASGLTGTTTQSLVINGANGAGGLLGVTIDNGAQYTRTPNVTVTAVFPKGTTQMLISNDGGFLSPESFPPQQDTPWKLDSSGPERLPKTIYVRFFNGPIASETFQDDIILDEIPPVVQSASLASSAGSAATASIARLKTWKVKVKAKDSNSGVKGVQVTSNKKKPGKLVKYKSKVKVKSATRPKWIRARDKAGNNSRWRKLK